MDLDLTDSDDDCELYTKTAEHFLKKRNEFQAEILLKLQESPKGKNEFQSEILQIQDSPKSNLNKDDSLVGLVSIDDSLTSEDDDDEDLPLEELRQRLIKKRRLTQTHPQLPQKRPKRNSRRQSRKTSRTTSETRNLGVIVLDDDTGYALDSLPPIDFNSRSHKKSKVSHVSKENISLESIIDLNEDSEEDKLIESDDLVTLTIEWNNCLKTIRKEFKLRRYQKFESIFEELAKMENISTNRVLLMYDYNSVNPWDTPSSLNLRFYGALIGAISPTEITRNKVNFDNGNSIVSVSGPVDGIQVKLLLQSKQTLLFKVLKHQKMDILYKKCAEELKCDKNNLRLTFDGEYVEPSDTVTDLDIEDGDVFHVHMKV